MNSIERFKMQAALAMIVVLLGGVFQLVSTLTRATAQTTRLEVQGKLEPYRVFRSVDGDTVQLVGIRKTVRLIGIDTPESKRNKKAKKDALESGVPLERIIALGKQAWAYTKQLVDGKDVFLETDVDPTDQYGRTLGYLYLPDPNGDFSSSRGRLRQVNLELVRAGWAVQTTYRPNVRYSSLYAQAETVARAARVGQFK
jgi:micrococcal nuclease